MHGNVEQLVTDCVNDSYRGAPADGSTWTTGDCAFHVTHGGSWSTTPDKLRSARRSGNGNFYRTFFVGFRVARTLTP